MLADLIKPYIPRLIRREVTSRAVARELGINETYLCKVLKKLKVRREPVVSKADTRQLNEARREHRLLVAATLPVKEAAKAAGCSTRTIYRLRSK